MVELCTALKTCDFHARVVTSAILTYSEVTFWLARISASFRIATAMVARKCPRPRMVDLFESVRPHLKAMNDNLYDLGRVLNTRADVAPL